MHWEILCQDSLYVLLPYKLKKHLIYILPFYVPPPPIDPISLCPLWHKLHHTSYLVICHTTKPSKNNMVSRNPKIFRFYLAASVIVLVRASNKKIYFNHLWWPCCTSGNPIIKPIQGFMLFLRFYFYFSPKLTSASISTMIASRNSLGGIFFFNSTFIPRKHHYWFNWLTL